ncbi:hypothetical protein WBG99_12175 [Streptomyces sp. TG1A-60]|uniref:hypothetical protein n=1 Tax=Streptomyces sp. TG1A-60 TaxID=3129111 RepID=UPI0030CF8252
MEQRIGSNNQPLAAAAVDPSHIPGLTAPVSVKKEKQEEPEDTKPTESVEPAEAEEPDEAAPDQDEPASAEKTSVEKTSDGVEADSDGEADDEADADSADSESSEGAEDSEGADTDDGPVFEASDRRAKIVADSRGVRLRLDDQECDFGWDEIGAIETESPRFGKRFTVTVHTPDSRWYPIEIEATAKSQHAEWETRIDEVLDAYFDDDADAAAAVDDDADAS